MRNAQELINEILESDAKCEEYNRLRTRLMCTLVGMVVIYLLVLGFCPL